MKKEKEIDLKGEDSVFKVYLGKVGQTLTEMGEITSLATLRVFASGTDVRTEVGFVSGALGSAITDFPKTTPNSQKDGTSGIGDLTEVTRAFTPFFRLIREESWRAIPHFNETGETKVKD